MAATIYAIITHQAAPLANRWDNQSFTPLHVLTSAFKVLPYLCLNILIFYDVGGKFEMAKIRMQQLTFEVQLLDAAGCLGLRTSPSIVSPIRDTFKVTRVLLLMYGLNVQGTPTAPPKPCSQVPYSLNSFVFVFISGRYQEEYRVVNVLAGLLGPSGTLKVPLRAFGGPGTFGDGRLGHQVGLYTRNSFNPALNISGHYLNTIGPSERSWKLFTLVTLWS
ncbi:hypothetical protein C8F04DRAFT_1182599 [Mycena alexandri]|uniref:Uncharacterized protein n=1 Tax=Mycena alexandri TaxID=1745969 RepID=A0AAD6SWN0_9AGAR|nr:hypothetical protein C8F04DRAFT_1182599 [Mycena alexandri]